MSSDLMDERRRLAKQRDSVASRDKPMLAARRRGQQQPEFFTDSLNTTYIPSPSPRKGSSSAHVLAKAKEEKNGRKLAAALQAEWDKEERDDSRSTTTSLHSQTRSRIPRSKESSAHASPNPLARTNPHSRRSTRTPSPPRGRQLADLHSPISVASASSPPRGLAEAYQRIEDEEYLAGQEDDTIDEEDMLKEQDNAQILGTNRSQLTQRSNSLDSPQASRRTSRKVSPQQPRPNHTPTTHADQTEGSEISNLFEDMAINDDTFDQKLSRHDRDRLRVQTAIAAGAQPFRKARLGGRRGLTTANLHRNDASSSSGSSMLGSPSVSSRASEPSLNIPSEWGRKARNDTRWLDRLEGGLQIAKPTLSSPEAATADKLIKQETTPNPSVHKGEPSSAETVLSHAQTKALLNGFPTSRVPLVQSEHQSMLDRTSDWDLDDEDLAVALSLTDKRQNPIKKNATGAIVEGEAVTDGTSLARIEKAENATKHIQPRPLQETIPSISGGNVSNIRQNGKLSPVTQAFSNGSARVSIEEGVTKHDQRPSPRNESHGVSIPNSPVVIFPARSDSSAELNPGNHTALAQASLSVSDRRADSRDLLRRLTRVASSSPKSDVPEEVKQEERSDLRFKEKVRDNQDSVQSGHSNRLSADKPHGLSVPVASQTRTPQPNKQSRDLKTPKVIGAWVDTPLPPATWLQNEAVDPVERISDSSDVSDHLLDIQGQEEEQTSIPANPSVPQKYPPLQQTAPTLPSSALSAILTRAKSKVNGKAMNENQGSSSDETLELGESTIHDLEGLLEAEASDPDQSQPTRQTDTFEKTANLSTLTPPSADESKSLERLSYRLTRLSASLREANKSLTGMEQALGAATTPAAKEPERVYQELLGIIQSLPQKEQERLEMRLEKQMALIDAAQRKKPIADDLECIEGGEMHDFGFGCDRCRARAAATIQWQPIQIPTIWRWRKGDSLPRFTLFGTILTVTVAFWAAEKIAVQYYTPPFYAHSMVGFGVDYRTPRPPFIVAKLLWRYFFGVVLTPVWSALCVLVRLIAGVLGFNPGIFGHANEYPSHGEEWELGKRIIPSIGRAVSKGASKYLGVEEEIGIGDDEYIH